MISRRPIFRRRKRNWLIYPAAIICLAVAAAIAMAPAWFQSYTMSSGSMRPTLLIGDRFFASRGYYGSHAPMRGDVAVFKDPIAHQDYVKRVIALPGDTVALKEGRLWLNGTLVEREATGTVANPYGGPRQQAYRETLPGGPSYGILENDDTSMADTFGPFLVPAESYFVLGDNRDESNDSRQPEFGAVPARDFRDRALIVYFSKTVSRIGHWIQ